MNQFLTIAIPKGRILKESIELFGVIGIDLTSMLEDSRKLIFEYPEQKIRALIVRATDVPASQNAKTCSNAY
jgi:ATP phosphoribosyltransferase